MIHFVAPMGRRRLVLLGLVLILGMGGLRTRYSIAITSGQSMHPTLSNGDILLVDNWAFKEETPGRGDVVVARARGEILVKRVVGLPGENLRLDAGELYVNGRFFPEEYTTQVKRLDITAGDMNQDRYALVGDNRSLIIDELVHAIVGSGDIGGRVIWALRLSSLRLIQVY